ncbi:hypothetical protein [Nocardia asteroides]|uniref:hypothetical protein n=1 Tax=Nocardia asteroides TaxID=1824 RepID=UPI0033E806A5
MGTLSAGAGRGLARRRVPTPADGLRPARRYPAAGAEGLVAGVSTALLRTAGLPALPTRSLLPGLPTEGLLPAGMARSLSSGRVAGATRRCLSGRSIRAPLSGVPRLTWSLLAGLATLRCLSGRTVGVPLPGVARLTRSLLPGNILPTRRSIRPRQIPAPDDHRLRSAGRDGGPSGFGDRVRGRLGCAGCRRGARRIGAAFGGRAGVGRLGCRIVLVGRVGHLTPLAQA